MGTTPTPGDDAARSVQAWVEGDSEAALGALGRLPASRERDLNRGIVLLYRGETGAASRLFTDLQARDPRWVPAARWLARAQKDAGSPEATETAAALLRLPGASPRDHLWAAELFAERNDLPRARDAFQRAVGGEPDLYLGWRGLAEVEDKLGHPDAARAARDKAEGLYPAPPVAHLPLAPPLPGGGPLRYRVKYFFVHVATLTLNDGGDVQIHGRRARLITLEAKSDPTVFFVHINSRFESYIGADGAVLAHRNLSDDSSTGQRQLAMDMDVERKVCVVRQVVSGSFSYTTIPLPPLAQEGLSVIEVARGAARARSSLSVVRIADATWKATPIQTMGTESIVWRGKKVETVRVNIGISSQAAAGVQGVIQLWVSADERAVLYRAKIAVPLGSLTLELLPPEG